MRKNISTISHFIPIAHYKERHATHVETSAENCWSALQEFNLEESKLTSLLFFFRRLRLPALASTENHAWSPSWISFFFSGFQPIVVNAPNSFVLWLGLMFPEHKNLPPQKKFFRAIQNR